MAAAAPTAVSTSADKRSQRPTKKRALTPVSQQSEQVEALFANPDREITIPNGPKAKTLAPPPEIVANVQGSSAGAGSGEFHVYKASRRRENERLRLMDEEVAKETADKEFRERQEALRKQDEEKLSKNRARREKAKARKMKGKGDGDMEADSAEPVRPDNSTSSVLKKKLGAAKIVPKHDTSEQLANGGHEEAQAGEEEVRIRIFDED